MQNFLRVQFRMSLIALRSAYVSWGIRPSANDTSILPEKDDRGPYPVNKRSVSLLDKFGISSLRRNSIQFSIRDAKLTAVAVCVCWIRSLITSEISSGSGKSGIVSVMSKKPSEEYSNAEAQERFEAALKGALKTPHKPLKPARGPAKKSKPEKKPGK